MALDLGVINHLKTHHRGTEGTESKTEKPNLTSGLPRILGEHFSVFSVARWFLFFWDSF